MTVRFAELAEHITERSWFRPALICGVLVAFGCLTAQLPPTWAEDESIGVQIPAGAKIDLFKQWPEIAKAPRAKIGTMEFLIRPDTEAVARPRSFILILSNRGGRDTAGVSLTLNNGAVRASILGTRLDAKAKLAPDEWTHVALTINQKTVNKQARLWINGQLETESLIPEYWPKTFEVAEMLSDYWSQGRVYSGQLGDVRISRTVRYSKPFDVPKRLLKDADCTVHLDHKRLPIK